MKLLSAIASFALLLQSALGDTRSSTDYAVTTEVADAGGARGTSANYSNDGSMGGMTGVATVATPAETVNHGYVGQIYNFTSFTVTAPQSSINQAATLQLGVAATLDDATTLNLTPDLVTWSVTSGPINSISAGGLATAGNVHQNTSAVVRGSYFGGSATLSLTVLHDRSLIESYDEWTQLSFTPGQLSANPTLGQPSSAPGHDGVSNLLKYLFDINPSAHVTDLDRAALPVVNLVNVSQTEYLALTYRKSTLVTGLNINLQTSTDLNSWTTVTTPDLQQQVGIDPNTGDPIIRVGVIKSNSPKQFVRLNVTQQSTP